MIRGEGSRKGDVTRLLMRWRAGDREALDELLPLVYEELRGLAARHMRGERSSHTLQTTALVHEAFLRMVPMEVSWHDRVHFMRVAARCMRRILVDHARARRSARRGGGGVRVTLEEAAVLSERSPADLAALDEALSRLARLDARKGEVIELHFFGGLTQDEIAAFLRVLDGFGGGGTPVENLVADWRVRAQAILADLGAASALDAAAPATGVESSAAVASTESSVPLPR